MAKVAFIQEELRERFGIMILSAVIKQGGHETEVFIQDRSHDIVDEVLGYRPDVIAFSTMTPGIKFALENARKLKEKSDALILMGGPHPTFYPEVIHDESLDVICVGEGEYALLELLDALDKGNDISAIKNLWVKKDGKIFKNELRNLVDVNQLPMFDRELYYDKYQELKTVPTKKFFIVRGCPYSCTYCFNHSFKKMHEGKGPYVRYTDPDKLILEMKYVLNKYGATWIQFNGDTMNVNRQWFMTFLDKYKQEINMPFMCNVRIELVDEEMVQKMKEAKCDRVDFGVEHGDEKIRRDVLKRNMTDRQIIDGGQLFRKYGIRVQTANIVGVPGETIETAMKTVEINRQFKPELARCFVLQPYPKTEIYDYALKNGYLEEDFSFSSLGTGFQIGFDGSASGMTLKLKHHRELTNLYYFFNTLVHRRWLTPLIKILIKFPPNKLFLFIHALPIVGIDVKYHKSWKRKLESIGGLFRVLLKK